MDDFPAMSLNAFISVHNRHNLLLDGPQHQKTSDMCVQWRFRSACVFAQSDLNLLWAQFGQPRMHRVLFLMRTTKTDQTARIESSLPAYAETYVFFITVFINRSHRLLWPHRSRICSHFLLTLWYLSRLHFHAYAKLRKLREMCGKGCFTDILNENSKEKIQEEP